MLRASLPSYDRRGPLIAVFILVVAFMIPPSQPVVQSLEMLANLYFFNGIAWAWVGNPFKKS
jgi:hypothetical protein